MQDEHEDWLDEDVSPDAHAAIQTQGQATETQQIDFDLNCVRCGYNLRSAFATSNCPECGEPVETTLRPDLLHMASLNWLGRLRKGANWIVTAIIMNLLLIPIAMVIGIASVRNLSQGGGLPTGTMAFLSLLGVIIVAVYAVGIWLVTSLEPNRINRPTSASLARWLIIPGMLLSILAEVFTNSGDSTAETIGGFIDLISSIMQLVGFLAGMIYLRSLAERIPEPNLAKQTTIVFWGWLVTMSGFIFLSIIAVLLALTATSASNMASALPVVGLMMIPIGLSMLVFGIWWIVLVFRYRTRFAQAHDIAIGRSKTIAADSV